MLHPPRSCPNLPAREWGKIRGRVNKSIPINQISINLRPPHPTFGKRWGGTLGPQTETFWCIFAFFHTKNVCQEQGMQPRAESTVSLASRALAGEASARWCQMPSRTARDVWGWRVANDSKRKNTSVSSPSVPFLCC